MRDRTLKGDFKIIITKTICYLIGHKKEIDRRWRNAYLIKCSRCGKILDYIYEG